MSESQSSAWEAQTGCGGSSSAWVDVPSEDGWLFPANGFTPICAGQGGPVGSVRGRVTGDGLKASELSPDAGGAAELSPEVGA